ncbi:APC family permease [Kordia jejudonensis]|uniref:APC family permease n=1 Tax=Kordia jejudonensis TaxID=1348245 RepID=UPI0006293FCA|nr:APC family permease [Kordia jejudonensis]
MKRKDLLAEITKRIKRNEYSYQIKKYLGSKGLSEAQQDEILAEAKKNIKDEKLQKLPARNKMIFAIFLSLAVLSFVFFMFILPEYDIYGVTIIMAVVGVIFVTIFTVIALTYLNRWKPEKVAMEVEDKLPVDYTSSFAIAIIPAIVLFFILSARFDAVEERILAETQVRTEGIIISGISTTSGTGTYSTIVVRYTTKNGKTKEVQAEVGNSEFNRYYQDQRVNIIYSSKYPSIMRLLTQEDNIRQFTDTEERNLLPEDLEAILTGDFIPSVTGLNKISFGWREDVSSGVWYNENKDAALKFIDDKEIAYMCDYISADNFVKALMEKGYKKVEGGEKRTVTMIQSQYYESDEFVAFVETTMKSNDLATIIQMARK